MTWSPGDVDVGIQSLLIQVYPILLSVLLSIDVNINKNQLSTFDAAFALTLSSSPLTVYLVVASIGDLCGTVPVSTSGSNLTASSSVPSEPWFYSFGLD